MSRWGVRHIGLKTRGLDAAERFYIGVLGLEHMFLVERMLFL